MLGHISKKKNKKKFAESIVKNPATTLFSSKNITASGCHRQTPLIPQGHGLFVIAATPIQLDDLYPVAGDQGVRTPLKITK